MESTESQKKEDGGIQNARLLLVDDQPANLDVLCKLLEARGYRILLAPSGQVALKTAARVVPDLILLDVMMPEMDGYEVCRRLKADAKTRDIPVIFVTAREMGREPPDLSPEVLERLQTYAFPGNVRELKNLIERALIESGGGRIQPHHLHFSPAPGAAAPEGAPSSPSLDLPMDLGRASSLAELWVVKRAIDQANGNVSEAARLLGTNRNRVYRILAQESAAE